MEICEACIGKGSHPATLFQTSSVEINVGTYILSFEVLTLS